MDRIDIADQGVHMISMILHSNLKKVLLQSLQLVSEPNASFEGHISFYMILALSYQWSHILLPALFYMSQQPRQLQNGPFLYLSNRGYINTSFRFVKINMLLRRFHCINFRSTVYKSKNMVLVVLLDLISASQVSPTWHKLNLPILTSHRAI